MSNVYELVIVDRSYSSWSLRGWLLFDVFGISCRVKCARLYTGELADMLRNYAPARTAPTIRTPDGVVIPDSLAIAEELASRHPDLNIWPKDSKARAVARVLATEMHASFNALRNDCPMNLRVSYEDCAPSQAVLDDVARLEEIWAWARAQCEADGPWLCGAYSAADAFFAPAAARIAGYNLPVSAQAQNYVAAHLAHPSFRQWRAMGAAEGADQPFYRRDCPQRPWPGPAPLNARVVLNVDETCQPENAKCPYSNLDVGPYVIELNGRFFGFCNAFCRDKTAADPEAWPAFMQLL